MLAPRLAANRVDTRTADKLKRLVARLDERNARLPPRAARLPAQRFRAWLTDNAIHGLARRFPGKSAGEGLPAAQRHTLAMAVAGFSICLFLAPAITMHVVAGIATLFFALVVALRVSACINLLAGLPLAFLRRRPQPIADADLPVYTILVPLFRETAVLRGLVEALTQLDYPAGKLDIKLVLESIDQETLRFARSLRLPAHFELLVVPDSFPRTKPKALNYALQLARGDYVVVYDAEDRPDPQQLRKALAAFRAGPPNLVCLQARLAIYNGAENFLTRQFALEYGSLFAGILPTLQSLALPIPLGGTSNHFRTAALKWLGGWDAYNVTEDADLGVRLVRYGYVCRILHSETREEAPCRLGPWIRQRTRWLKGWMQTWFVHMRRPLKLWRQLGTAGFLGFHVTIGGIVVSALAYPVFWGIIGMEALTDRPFRLPEHIVGLHVWLVALFNLAVGFLASMALSLIALRQAGARLAPHILLMPAYWLLISLAAYRALGQLVTRPFHWEKTEHGVSSVSPHPAPR